MNFEDYSPYTRHVLSIWGARVDAYAAETRKLRELEDAEVEAVCKYFHERTAENEKAVIAAGQAVIAQQERNDLAKWWCDLAKDSFDESRRTDQKLRAAA
jgi:hypothetical protein